MECVPFFFLFVLPLVCIAQYCVGEEREETLKCLAIIACELEGVVDELLVALQNRLCECGRCRCRRRTQHTQQHLFLLLISKDGHGCV